MPIDVKGGILNLLITNIEDHINNIVIENITSTLSSDHFITTFDTNMTSHIKKTNRYAFDFSKGDLEGLNSNFLDVNFILSFASNDINNTWQPLKSVILNACSLFIAKVYLKAHQHHRLFSPTLRHHLNHIHSLGRQDKHDPSSHNITKLHEGELNLEDLMIKAQTKYESHIFNTNAKNCKSAYLYMHSTSKKLFLPQHVFFNSLSASSPHERAEQFNDYFYSVYQSKSVIPVIQLLTIYFFSIANLLRGGHLSHLLFTRLIKSYRH